MAALIDQLFRPSIGDIQQIENQKHLQNECGVIECRPTSPRPLYYFRRLLVNLNQSAALSSFTRK